MKQKDVLAKIIKINNEKNENEIAKKMVIGGAVSYLSGKEYKEISQMSLEPGEYVTERYIASRGWHIKDWNEKHYMYSRVCRFKKVKAMDENGNEQEKDEYAYGYFKENIVYEIGNVRDGNGNPIPRKWKDKYSKEMWRAKKAMADAHKGTFGRCWKMLHDYCQKYEIESTNDGLYTKGKLGYVIHNGHNSRLAKDLEGVHVPHICRFESIERFFSVAFHEMVHSTAKQLERKLSFNHKSKRYAIEECVAEVGAKMLMERMGIGNDYTDECSRKYIEYWGGRLKEKDWEYVKIESKKAIEMILEPSNNGDDREHLITQRQEQTNV